MIDPMLLNQSIQVDVSFYDKVEEKKLLDYPTEEQLKEVTAKPIEIPFAEFLTYYLFHRKGRKSSGFASYQEIALQVERAWSYFEGFIDFNGQSICRGAGVENQLNDVTEHIGESIGLSVISRIHRLTEADWNPIPQNRGPQGKRFDFQIASTGNFVVQVENKGS